MLGPARRFQLALALFLAWIAVLAGMAIRSAESPRELPAAVRE